MSVVKMFTAIAAITQVAYFSFDSESLKKSLNEIKAFFTEKKYARLLIALIVIIPLLAGLNVYLEKSRPLKAPVFGRALHPAPPTSISFKGKTIDLVAGTNPFRELKEKDPEKFAEHVENGKLIYCANCSYCHGANMQGKGNFAHGLDPFPTKFADPTILPDLQESFVFWRVAKGAPGMPDEGAPWASSMPAWEPFLTEEEIWDVILYIYEFNGMVPRALVEHTGGGGGEH
jgi:mono/diheme cytochrome c family protein